MKKLSFRRSRRTLNPAPRIPRIYTWNGGHEAKVVNLNLESATRKVRYEGMRRAEITKHGIRKTVISFAQQRPFLLFLISLVSLQFPVDANSRPELSKLFVYFLSRNGNINTGRSRKMTNTFSVTVQLSSI